MWFFLWKEKNKGKLGMERNHACHCRICTWDCQPTWGETYVGHQCDWHAWRREQPGNTAPPKVSTEPQRGLALWSSLDCTVILPVRDRHSTEDTGPEERATPWNSSNSLFSQFGERTAVWGGVSTIKAWSDALKAACIKWWQWHWTNQSKHQESGNKVDCETDQEVHLSVNAYFKLQSTSTIK